MGSMLLYWLRSVPHPSLSDLPCLLPAFASLLNFFFREIRLPAGTLCVSGAVQISDAGSCLIPVHLETCGLALIPSAQPLLMGGLLGLALSLATAQVLSGVAAPSTSPCPGPLGRSLSLPMMRMILNGRPLDLRFSCPGPLVRERSRRPPAACSRTRKGAAVRASALSGRGASVVAVASDLCAL